jgi:hypothetical protein
MTKPKSALVSFASQVIGPQTITLPFTSRFRESSIRDSISASYSSVVVTSVS